MNLRTIERDIAGAVIISADGKLLMGQKVPHSGAVYAQGYWVIPGGGVEPGETVLQALHREIFEETGLNSTPYPVSQLPAITGRSVPKPLPTGETVIAKMEFLNFRVDIPLPAADIPIGPSDELPILEWFELADLGKVKLSPPSVELFTKLGFLSEVPVTAPKPPKNKS